MKGLGRTLGSRLTALTVLWPAESVGLRIFTCSVVGGSVSLYPAATSRRRRQQLMYIWHRRTVHLQPSDTPRIRLLFGKHLRSTQRKSNMLMMVPRIEAATAIATIAPVPSGCPELLLWIGSTVAEPMEEGTEEASEQH